eukprot:Sspe_Gene.118864::Locus_113326_Transcript_1_1_Confidence_1.000_Length_1297::g.118864::m.118864
MGSKTMPLGQFAAMLVLYSKGVPQSKWRGLMGGSESTMSRFSKALRSRVARKMQREQDEVMLGGPGVVVEIDEACIMGKPWQDSEGKMFYKYNRIIGLLERGSQCPKSVTSLTFSSHHF